MATQCEVKLSKQSHKFSAAHMTLFPNGKKEALHGHNYYVSLRVSLSSEKFKEMVGFSELKKPLKELCDTLDEKILIASQNPFTKITAEGGECTVIACGKRYVFPEEEVVVLPIENITTECLSAHLAGLLEKQLPSSLLSITVGVEESEGQQAEFTIVRV